eukprot:1080964-Pelagomonas_calceolata.AAC.2
MERNRSKETEQLGCTLPDCSEELALMYGINYIIAFGYKCTKMDPQQCSGTARLHATCLI